MWITDLGHRPLIVAAATPLSADGATVDTDAIGPYAKFLVSHGADGVFACGTTGEGVLLSVDERRAVADAYRDALDGILVVHAGAQSTADTVELAAHAVEIGADAVAVIPPPYFPLDADALTAHFVAAARACAPLPFFCYAFAPRSGYPLPVEVVGRIAGMVDNLAGLKVSESPFSAVAPYLELGLPVLIGNEPLLAQGLAAGAVGTVSGVAAAFPDVVRAALDRPDSDAMANLAALRRTLGAGGEFIAAVKHALGRRGVAVGPGMRAPLRRLNRAESTALDEGLIGWLARTAVAQS